MLKLSIVSPWSPMTTESLPLLSKSGVYLLSNRKKASISLNGFLVITLHSPSSGTTAVILTAPEEHRADFLNQMDKIHQKYISLSDVDSNLIQCKIFGTGDRFGTILTALKGWLSRNHIPVVASDLGRPLSGEMMVEGATGRVGIQFKKNSHEAVSSLLSTGTARNRNQSSKPAYKVLVLTQSQVVKTLAQQSIEEDPAWAAFSPDKVQEKTITKVLTEQKWSAVLISDELKTQTKLIDQIIGFAQAHPTLPMGWIGGELPHWKNQFNHLKLLPPLEPFLIPHFKKVLKNSILSLSLSETSDTLSFPKRKKAGA